jgi:hypothetical protein
LQEWWQKQWQMLELLVSLMWSLKRDLIDKVKIIFIESRFVCRGFQNDGESYADAGATRKFKAIIESFINWLMWSNIVHLRMRVRAMADAGANHKIQWKSLSVITEIKFKLINGIQIIL